MFIHCAMVFPIILHYLAFAFAFRNVRNLQISVEKFVGEVSTILLYTKSVTCTVYQEIFTKVKFDEFDKAWTNHLIETVLYTATNINTSVI